jgi:hypothetical protein
MLEFKCVRLLQSNPANLSSPSSSLSLLDIRLLTGRKHQIRAQLSHLGHPIVGDPVYGYVYHPSHPEAAARFVSEQFVLYVLYDVERKICTLLVLPLNNVYIQHKLLILLHILRSISCLLRNFMYTYVYNKKIRRSLYCPTRLSAVLSSSSHAEKNHLYRGAPSE